MKQRYITTALFASLVAMAIGQWGRVREWWDWLAPGWKMIVFVAAWTAIILTGLRYGPHYALAAVIAGAVAMVLLLAHALKQLLKDIKEESPCEVTHSQAYKTASAMLHIIDHQKREIRVQLPAGSTATLEEVRAHIDKLYGGTEVASYTVHFQPVPTYVNVTGNALPFDIEYRLRSHTGPQDTADTHN